MNLKRKEFVLPPVKPEDQLRTNGIIDNLTTQNEGGLLTKSWYSKLTAEIL
jgi:hypothetical protein